jgi:peptide/nickel transport system ATP-binding protein/oligopeptide transport system ATP-binding protein
MESGGRNNETLVQVRGARKYFPLRENSLNLTRRYVKAVDGVDLDIHRGQTFGLVGESGCGKSTLGRALVALLPLSEGKVFFEGKDLAALGRKKMKEYRKKMQFIFQDSGASMNPRQTIANILLEPLRVHHIGTKQGRIDRMKYLVGKVGLSDYHLSRYPHELSGGQKQRVGIARALALQPSLIVCDEAVSSLDVSIQAQVINLLADLQKEFSLTYLFISHNLSVVHHVSNWVGVMYLGKLVEIGTHDDIFKRPAHFYTRALLSAIPGTGMDRIVLMGDVPSPIDPPSGCRFHNRCPYCDSLCKTEEPKLEKLSLSGGGHAGNTIDSHYAACHYPGRL